MTKPVDSDALAIRRASRLVGTRIALACAGVVIAVILGMFLYILSEISPAELFEPVPDTDNLRVSAVNLLRAASVLGAVLIFLAGGLSWLVTRGAVRPLGDALRIQRSFVADASHELRTPLAVLDARLQILQRTLPAGDPSAEVVAELRGDAADLIRIVNDLLESAEAGGAAATAEVVEMTGAVRAAVESMRLIAEAKNITIALDTSSEAATRVPATSLTRCVVALLDNALRFAPPGSTVSVTVTATKKTVALTVRDQGQGIQGIDPARIFDRFAHAGPAVGGGGDTRTGFGIGLSLVRDIAVRHGGSVTVVESSGAGTAIRFEVPRDTRPPAESAAAV
ncbi:HAMP domain-containing sensor histidine kinase [Cryobacterium sp. PAMC25264]|uniref:sensor histidine kinase n=1 Tax=Cryobacterium sp. PAMC25264 TaxID=2861288 RepID=UPI001C624E7B|nr:HAMP domain-containing sensor histidine kinase [Cryobacterium sp. PAMC25264]QYF73176.1 HAMP domain-containing histidine kinase [Cryobacterium sp. PAMC25264]